MSGHSTENLLQDVVCPFCGLCCDDLVVRANGNRLDVVSNGCTRADRGFNSPTSSNANSGLEPQILGAPCSLGDAVALTANLLGSAHLPLFGGLGTDVAGARALLQLADRCGATFDHMNSAAMLRNLLVVQDSGWMTTTLTEVRNRADIMLVFGGKLERHSPRFYERIFNKADSLFEPHHLERELIVIGERLEQMPVDDNVRTTLIECRTDQLGAIAMAMRAILNGASLRCDHIAGIPLERLQTITRRFGTARYGIVAWVAAELAFSHAELAIQAFCELVKELNDTTRWAALPLGGDNGDHTFAQVATWQTGYPTRVSLARGHPHYDPAQHDSERMLSDGEADVLVWVSAFDTQRKPPPVDIPTIVLGQAGMELEMTPDVFIPVATPGLDHAGHVYRCDTVVTLPLCGLRHSDFPPVSDTVHAILDKL